MTVAADITTRPRSYRACSIKRDRRTKAEIDDIKAAIVAADKITGAKLKRMGVLAGASDLLIWHRGNSFALELKARGRRLSEAQLEFHARFNEAGGHTAWADTIDGALNVLTAWGLLR